MAPTALLAAFLPLAAALSDLLPPASEEADAWPRPTTLDVYETYERQHNTNVSKVPLWSPSKEYQDTFSADGSLARTRRSATAIPARARCKNNTPILSELFCNGVDDCGDGSDELDCSFQCEDGSRKMPRTWQCDGDKDCLDSSDEQCFLCISGAMIPKEWRCDGERDCPGDEGEDEQCFTCGNGKRLIPQFVCDGDNDCGDHSDEAACFRCTNGKSISSTWRCDGADDCGDNSDERRCDEDSLASNLLPRLRASSSRRSRGSRGSRGRRAPAPRGKQRDSVAIDATLRSYILKWHNRHRLQLAKGDIKGQPAAANMKLLRWDKDIAVKSQKWAEQCDYMHESDKHCKTGGYHSLGENIAVSTINYPGTMTTDADLLAMVKHALESMWNEHEYYTFGRSPGKCTREPCGHYTQMVWAETEAVGCGLTSCNSIRNWAPGRSRHTLFLVCKYGPAGNINGINPYNKGKACSGCGAKESNCRSGGLCTADSKKRPACADSEQSCESMKARGVKGRYTCWPCDKWKAEGTCDVCANTFRHAREMCAKTCGLCKYDYTLNNLQ